MLHIVSINCRYSHSCLAQFYLRNELERRLPEQRIHLSQFTINDPYYETLLRITAVPAGALFFSVYIWNHHYICRLIADLERVSPHLLIVIGGPQAPSLVESFSHVTLVCGEIEGVGEIFYRDLAEGILKAEYRAEPGSSFPSPYREKDFSTVLKNRQVYYESSRGCPFFCSYCLSSVSRGVRRKPLETVRKELAQLIAVSPLIIKFVDRTFNDDPGRALAIWQFLVEQGPEVRYHFEITPDRFTEPMFEFLATVPAGLFQFEIGIQSCNRQTLAAVNRQMDLNRAEENIRRLMDLDTIHLHVDLILGLPYESGASFRDSFNRVFRCRPHYIQLGLLKVLPSTEMAKRAGEYGLLFCKDPPYEVLATRWLQHDELRYLHAFCECVQSFYNNRYFPSLWAYLQTGVEEPFVFFQSLLALCFEQGFFQLARTQQLMNRILVEAADRRQDCELLQEMLCFDWLRSGHQTLPRPLATAERQGTRDRLRRTLPQNLDGVYDYRSRNAFLKKNSFIELSAKAADILFPDSSGPVVAVILPEKQIGVKGQNRALLLPNFDSKSEPGI